MADVKACFGGFVSAHMVYHKKQPFPGFGQIQKYVNIFLNVILKFSLWYLTCFHSHTCTHTHGNFDVV